MKFSVIYTDNPHEYKDKCHSGERGANYKYPTMSKKDIDELPIKDLAADDCVLFFWATFPLLPDCLDTIAKWGFNYKTLAFVWIKKNKISDTPFWGMGNWTRSNAEVCLLATRGRPQRLSKAVHSVIFERIQEHSKKPAIVRDKIVELCGDVPRVELFSRAKVDGWVSIGNDIDGKDIRESLKELIDAH